MQPYPAREGLRAAKRPDWKPLKHSPLCQSLQPAAAVPCRGGFEGGQTSGLKAVKTQPSVPKPARTVKSQVLRPQQRWQAQFSMAKAKPGWNWFAVQAGQISPRTRQHGHSCPLCQTLVWSPHLSGRIRSVHDTPEGKRCQKTEWTVAEPRKRKKH